MPKLLDYLPSFQQGGPAERPPILGYMQPGFNPEGYGYDINTAEEAGLERDEFGHMGSLDPRTGMVLKGRKHESWNPMVQEEMYRGNTVMYNPNEDRYFSIEGGMYEPAVQDETAHSQMDKLMFENELKQQPQYYMSEYDEGYDPAREWGEGMLPVGGFAKLIKPGSRKIKGILSKLKMSQLANDPKIKKSMIEGAKRERLFEQGLLPKKDMEIMMKIKSQLGYKPQYKDAPQRKLQDIIIKLDELSGHSFTKPSKKDKLIGRAKVNLDKTLERVLKQYDKTGMVSPSNEKAIWESHRALEEIIR